MIRCGIRGMNFFNDSESTRSSHCCFRSKRGSYGRCQLLRFRSSKGQISSAYLQSSYGSKPFHRKIAGWQLVLYDFSVCPSSRKLLKNHIGHRLSHVLVPMSAFMARARLRRTACSLETLVILDIPEGSLRSVKTGSSEVVPSWGWDRDGRHGSADVN